MKKNNNDDATQFRQLRHHKSPSILSYKSQKALKVLSSETQNSKPFRRRQENIVNANKVNKINLYPQDIGKLIINTSFGSNPNIQKILSSSPRNFQCNDHVEDPNVQIKTNPIASNMRIIRQNKSMSNFEKIGEITRLPSPRITGVVESAVTGNIKTSRTQNEHLLQKIQRLSNQKSELQAKLKKIQEKLAEVTSQLSNKQQKLNEYTNEIENSSLEISQQKQINKCLEDIIVQLNCKIEVMIQEKQKQCIERQKQMERKREQECVDMDMKEQELRKEIDELKQKVYGLNRIISGYEVQSMSMKKLKHELQRQKSCCRCLQKQNKTLKQRMLNMIKSNKIKQPKLSLRKQLDYSISFDLDI